MAQTENAISFIEADAYLGATDPPTLSWGPYGISIAVAGGERAVGSQHVRDGDYPIQKAGKREGLTLTVRYVYTQTASELHDVALGIYDTAGGACAFKYIPGSEADLGLGYMVTGGIMTNFKYPEGNVSDGAIVPGEFVISTPRLIEYQVS